MFSEAEKEAMAHALEGKSSSKAVAYVGIAAKDAMFWGAGIQDDIINASVSALVSAINRACRAK